MSDTGNRARAILWPSHPPLLAGRRPAARPLPSVLPTIIGDQLRRYYAALLEEPLPPRLLQLVRDLDERGSDE